MELVIIFKHKQDKSRKEKVDPSVLDDIKTSSKRDSTELENVVDILLNDRYKRRKTILTNNQISPITTLDVIAQLFDIPFLKEWVDAYAEWRTSGDGGKGRQDIVEISKFSYAEKQRMDNSLIEIMRNR